LLNDKVLKSVADAVTKVMAEALKGDQHKIDKNKNNKIDAHDFKLLRKEETVTEEEKKKPNPFDWKNTPRETREKGELTGHESKRTSTGTVYTKKAVKEEASQEEYTKEIAKAKAKDAGKVAQPEVAKPAVQAVQQEEVEQIEAEALIENYEMINEVSVGAKIRAYAQHSRDAFDHNDMGNEDEADRHSERASKIMKHIEKHHGPEAVKHAKKAGHAAIFGRDDPHGHGDGGHDVLHGGLRSNKTVTKAGKVPKGTQSAMKNKIMAYGRHRDTAGPKGHLPEEVQIDERHLTSGEKADVEKNVKGMKKNLQGFKARYGKDAKSVMYATATANAKKSD
jgi:hypothetical protein